MRIILVALCCFFICACSAKPFVSDSNLDSSNSARVVIYTPDTAFNRQNFIRPGIYVDGLVLGKVAIDTPLSVQLPAGVHHIAFQRSFPLMPVLEAASIKIEMQPKETYYIRYSYDFDDHAQTHNEPATTGASSFRLVAKTKGENRE